MDFKSVPRRAYTSGPTPIEYLENLSKLLNGPDIFIKRDDHLGLAGGGNKTRKLEFLLADALRNKADTIITCGAVQSNHCRLTLSAAKKEKLDCHLVLEERVPNSYSPTATGNNLLYSVLDADSKTVVPGGSDMIKEMEKVAKKVEAEGKKPYIIPMGGSNEIGALGYAACAEEINLQLKEDQIDIDYIITPTGSSGTHAGLLLGMGESSRSIPIIGISVNNQTKAQEEKIFKLLEQTSEYLNIENRIEKSAVKVLDDYIGLGYSLPSDGMIEAVKLLAQSEGILLDPVYTGKTMHGLIDLIRSAYFKTDDKVLFMHTGGSPALFNYGSLFQ